MDIYTQILKSRPLTAFALNAAGTAYVDLTNRGVTLSATPPLTSIGTVAGSFKAALVTGGTAYNFTNKLFKRSQERRGFTLQATVTALDLNTGFISILSHNAVEDGLHIKANEVRFTVEFNTLGTVTVAAPISTGMPSLTVHAVYNVAKIQLYVNGVLASEANITPAQVADGFKTRASDNLYISQGTVGKKIIVDAIATYTRALTDAEVYLHYRAARTLVNHENAAQAAGALFTIDGGSNSRNINFNRTWNYRNWSEDATASNIAYSADLEPSIDDATGLTVAGTWTVAISTTDLTTLYGMVARWESTGTPVVEASIDDGTTWLPMTNGIVLPQTYNLAVTNKNLLVRVRFAAGQAPGVSKISSLQVSTYQSNLIQTSNVSRSMTATSGVTTSDTDYDGAIGQGYNGFIVNGGYVALAADTVDLDPVSSITSIETMVKFNKLASGGYVYDARPGVTNGYLWYSTTNTLQFNVGTLYVNGVAAATNTVALTEGVWYHLVHVLPSASNAAINIGPSVATGQNQYAFFNFYPSLTAAQAKALFDSHIRVPRSRLMSDASPLTETGYSTYQYDWSMTPAGI